MRWLCLLLLLTGCSQTPSGPQTRRVTTDVVQLDGLIRPDSGPRSSGTLLLGKSFPRRVFLTGASLKLEDLNGQELSSQRIEQLLCGASFCFSSPERHQALMQLKRRVDPSIFLFCPGQLEVRLPEGYGIAVQTNERLVLTVDWMNRDLYLPADTRVRGQLTLHYDTAEKKPLWPVSVYALTLVEGQRGYWNGVKAGPECPRAPRYGTLPLLTDGLGQQFQSKWLTRPGRQANHTLVTAELNLPLRAVAAAPYYRRHLEALELRDLTQNSSLFRMARGQVQWQPCALPADHQFQLVSVYNNPEPVAHDALAMLMLYAEER